MSAFGQANMLELDRSFLRSCPLPASHHSKDNIIYVYALNQRLEGRLSRFAPGAHASGVGGLSMA